MGNSQFRISRGSMVYLLVLAATPSPGSTIFSYPGFSNSSGLTFVGNTAITTTSDGPVLRVTPASTWQTGAAYSTSPVTLGTNEIFSTQFQFRFSAAGGIDPADGITFVLAAGTSGLGGSGGGLGYQSVTHSVAVEFDTYNNGTSDGNSSNHVAIDTNGSLNVLDLTNVYGISACNFVSSTLNTVSGCMSNGDLWTANVAYDGSNLTVQLLDPSEGTVITPISNYAINIASQLGTNTAYVGFTGSTGGGLENQDVVNWQFANTNTIQITTPEPASFLLLCLGLPALKLKRLRMRSKD